MQGIRNVCEEVLENYCVNSPVFGISTERELRRRVVENYININTPASIFDPSRGTSVHTVTFV